jgi:hypothetical protein
MAKFDHVDGLVITNMSAENHIFVKIARIKNACGESDFLNVCVDMVFTLQGQLQS